VAFTVAVGFAVIGAVVAAYALRPGSERAEVVDRRERVEPDERQALAA
jgi:hypothetical protein